MIIIEEGRRFVFHKTSNIEVELFFVEKKGNKYIFKDKGNNLFNFCSEDFYSRRITPSHNPQRKDMVKVHRKMPYYQTEKEVIVSDQKDEYSKKRFRDQDRYTRTASGKVAYGGDDIQKNGIFVPQSTIVSRKQK